MRKIKGLSILLLVLSAVNNVFIMLTDAGSDKFYSLRFVIAVMLFIASLLLFIHVSINKNNNN